MLLADVTEVRICTLQQKKKGRGHQDEGVESRVQRSKVRRDSGAGHFLVFGGRTQHSSILHNMFARFPVGDPFESQHMHFPSSFRTPGHPLSVYDTRFRLMTDRGGEVSPPKPFERMRVGWGFHFPRA